jgi:hypothetical protein
MQITVSRKAFQLLKTIIQCGGMLPIPLDVESILAMGQLQRAELISVSCGEMSVTPRGLLAAIAGASHQEAAIVCIALPDDDPVNGFTPPE